MSVIRIEDCADGARRAQSVSGLCAFAAPGSARARAHHLAEHRDLGEDPVWRIEVAAKPKFLRASGL